MKNALAISTAILSIRNRNHIRTYTDPKPIKRRFSIKKDDKSNDYFDSC